MSDPRSRRVAVVSDALLASSLARLEQEGFGVIQLPPAGLGPETTTAWLEQVAEHVAEFSRNDYEVVLVTDGEHADELAAALRALGAPVPESRLALGRAL